MTRGERAILWLLDAECRLREVAYSLAPTDERHAAWRAAEAKHCRFLNACVGPEPTDPETRDEKPWDEGSVIRMGDVIHLVDASDESMVSHVFGPESER